MFGTSKLERDSGNEIEKGWKIRALRMEFQLFNNMKILHNSYVL